MPKATTRPPTRMARKGAPPRRGFVSRKQWRWAFVNRQPWARRVAHRTRGGERVRYRRLPLYLRKGK